MLINIMVFFIMVAAVVNGLQKLSTGCGGPVYDNIFDFIFDIKK